MIRRALLVLAVLLLSLPAQAQLIPPIQIEFFNSAGTGPAANGFLCTTQSGGSVSQLTYQDQALTVVNQNPVRLNAAGRPVNGSNEVAIFLQQLNYRFTLYAAGTGNTCNGLTVGAQLRQVDGVNGVLVTGSAQVAHLGLGAAADGTAPLLVSQASNTNTILIVNSSVNKNWGIYNITNGAATDLRFNESNASADRLTLLAGGNVGIGTTNPTETLHVSGTGRFTRLGVNGASDSAIPLLVTGGSANVQLSLTGTLTTTSAAQLLGVTSTLNATAGASAVGMYLSPALQKASSGTHPLMAGMQVVTSIGAAAGTITDSAGIDISTFGTSGTNATGLRVAAPTGATNNYAIHATSGSVLVDSVGPHAIGSSLSTASQLLLGGAFTGSADTVGLNLSSSLSGVANQNVHGLIVQSGITKASSGTHPLLSGVEVNIGAIGAGGGAVTNTVGVDIASFTAAASTTNASGLRVAAPVSATNNYAINMTSGVLHYAQTTVGALPTCNAGNNGSVIGVTDSNATTFNAIIAGGGANGVLAMCDGTNWRIH